MKNLAKAHNENVLSIWICRFHRYNHFAFVHIKIDKILENEIYESS